MKPIPIKALIKGTFKVLTRMRDPGSPLATPGPTLFRTYREFLEEEEATLRAEGRQVFIASKGRRWALGELNNGD